MTDLFAQKTEKMSEKTAGKSGPRPLADRLRPDALEQIVGQDHLLGPDGPLHKMAESGVLASMILWGPPGCGKTTMARILAGHSGLHFEQISAIFSGVADLRAQRVDPARQQHRLERAGH